MKTTRRTLLKLAGGTVFVAAAPAILTRPARAADKRIAMIVKNLGNSYFDACANGAKEAAKELGGIEIIYTASAKPTAEEQIAVIDAQIAQKVDGIIVSANDADALVPVGKKAMERGIKVMSFDSAIAPAGRIVHLSASSTPLIGAKQVQMIAKTLGGKGEVAILSAASTMTNQNSWIEAMKEEWKKPEYKDMPLVATVYGDDQDDKSYREMQGLVKALSQSQGRDLADHHWHPFRRQGHRRRRPDRQGLHHRARPAFGNEGLRAAGRLRYLRDLEPGRVWLFLDADHGRHPERRGHRRGRQALDGQEGRDDGWRGRRVPSWASPSSSTRPTSRNSRKSSDHFAWKHDRHGRMLSGHGRNERLNLAGLPCLIPFSPFPAFPRSFPASGRCTMSAFRCARPRDGARRRERRGQIHDRQNSHRHLQSGRRRNPRRRRARNRSPRRAMPGRPALPRSIRKR